MARGEPTLSCSYCPSLLAVFGPPQDYALASVSKSNSHKEEGILQFGKIRKRYLGGLCMGTTGIALVESPDERANQTSPANRGWKNLTLHQLMAHGVTDQIAEGAKLQLPHDVSAVGFDGFHADA